ncbi:hypothetical protein NK214_03555 [Chromobacterium sp. S0633]|uniref:hypothetical protein n=1 Tax=Chromobacterium sp. S0633 TaxID=2957805 RepID=UPI00209F8696|nr:hypothetical protein [Chromobacterium sp. S0633]MCP1289256.1 hypothetical protein [Chromobacterium sp. S0633]
MQVIKVFLSLVVLSSCAWSAPYVDVVNSCRNGVPAAKEIGLTRLDGGAFVLKPNSGCEYQYQIPFGGRNYGYSTCNDQQYLIVSDRFFLSSQAINHSIDKNVSPGYPFAAGSTRFYSVLKGKESYICVTAPAYESGKGAAYATFYLIKHEPNLATPEVDFYFLDEIK